MRLSILLERLLLLLVLVVSTNTLAAERERQFKMGRGKQFGNERSERPSRVNVGRTQYNGNGCPNGTMSVAFAPDNLSFSLLFDQFIAQVEDPSADKRDGIACDALISIAIPENMQMEITRVDFRGFIGLPNRSSANIVSIFNFRGPGGDRDRIRLNYAFKGPMMEDYEISSDTITASNQTVQTEVSPCGGNVILRAFTRLNVRSANRNEAAMVTLDSIDGTANAVYYVNWHHCVKERRRANIQ